jgi:hypothetical protein
MCGAESEGRAGRLNRCGARRAMQLFRLNCIAYEGGQHTCSPEKASKIPLSTTKKNRDHVLKSPAVCIFMCLHKT